MPWQVIILVESKAMTTADPRHDNYVKKAVTSAEFVTKFEKSSYGAGVKS